MNCIKCGKTIQDASVFCNFCGKKQSAAPKKRATKTRGNGMGCAYRRPGQNTWTVEVVAGWRYPDDDITKPKRPVRKTKGGFKTKKEALDYVWDLQHPVSDRPRMTMQELWIAWEKFYTPRVGASTMQGYFYAYQHFNALHGTYMDLIKADDLQKCMDACPSGKRTHENMRCVANLLWKYAIDINVLDRNVAANLFTGKGRSVQREPLTDYEESVIKSAIGRERYAEYVYCLCWLGYRPGELLQLRKDQLFCARLTTDNGPLDVWYFVNGKKTDAGRDRVVVVPDEILPIIIDRTYVPGTDLLFPQYLFKGKKTPELERFKQMEHDYFNKHVFKPMMARLGIAEGKTPYSARHSYADKLKSASGADRDKAALIGHSNYMFTQDKYQSTHMKDLYEIVNSFSKIAIKTT